MIATQIRCLKCAHWNQTDDIHALCSNCGAELRPVSAADLESIERRKTAFEFKLPIYQSDSGIKRFTKHVYNSVVLVYMSIIAFFLWFFAAGPG